MKDVIDQNQDEQAGSDGAHLQVVTPAYPIPNLEPPNATTDVARAPAKTSREFGDVVFGGLVRGAVWLFLAVLVGIITVLIIRSMPTVQSNGLYFIFGDTWDPGSGLFGAAPAIVGTIIVAGAGMILAGTVGLASSIYLVEFSPRRLREGVAFLIELLAFIPSVVYGLWGLLVMVPWLQQTVQPWILQNFGTIPFFNGAPYGVGLMAAVLILSIMLLPLIVSLSREALLLVPDSQREAMLAVGATRWEVLRHAVLPYARGGIFGATILSLGRALGETMAVAMLIGGSHRFATNLFDQGYTLSSVIANEFGEAASEMHLSALVEAGLILIIITAAVNLGGFYLMRRMSRMQGARV